MSDPQCSFDLTRPTLFLSTGELKDWQEGHGWCFEVFGPYVPPTPEQAEANRRWNEAVLKPPTDDERKEGEAFWKRGGFGR